MFRWFKYRSAGDTSIGAFKPTLLGSAALGLVTRASLSITIEYFPNMGAVVMARLRETVVLYDTNTETVEPMVYLWLFVTHRDHRRAREGCRHQDKTYLESTGEFEKAYNRTKPKMTGDAGRHASGMTNQ